MRLCAYHYPWYDILTLLDNKPKCGELDLDEWRRSGIVCCSSDA